ncbi:SPOR domain-containing protein [Ferdinandcohnia quinoae]|uniref:SPOR domain-containing protein n=1 Tax=Fredinandcohnia quinoae TaxID=2918902 RepID=A0AAW5E4V0_9BACI|nr:hypothetical protein [Fredinandcohnia sp. SECRCQ15]MCH1626579.1 hypothetical protein [Fredinandcohnia sp. SECRCQ15]
MDKHQNKISIKINGKERTVPERNNEHFQLHQADEEIAAAREEEENFTWVLPDESIQNEKMQKDERPIIPIEDLRDAISSNRKGIRPTRIKGNQIFTLKQIVMTTILAVFIGVGFGIMILMVVKDTNQKPVNTTTSSVSANEKSKPEDKSDAKAGKTSAFQLEPLSIGVIQGGRFSTADAADVIVNELKAAGYAAIEIEQDGFFYVLIGAGLVKEDLAGLKSKYTDPDTGYFAKEFVINGGSYKTVPVADSNLISHSIEVFQELLSISSQAFNTGAISEEQSKQLEGLDGKLKSIKLEGVNEKLSNFVNSLSNSQEYLHTYKKSDNDKALWQSQQSLLDAYKNYGQWVGQLK